MWRGGFGGIAVGLGVYKEKGRPLKRPLRSARLLLHSGVQSAPLCCCQPVHTNIANSRLTAHPKIPAPSKHATAVSATWAAAADTLCATSAGASVT